LAEHEYSIEHEHFTPPILIKIWIFYHEIHEIVNFYFLLRENLRVTPPCAYPRFAYHIIRLSHDSPIGGNSTICLSHFLPIPLFAYWGERTRFAYWGQKHDSPIPGYTGIKVDLEGLRAKMMGLRREMGRK
jgi:hypothetical protein